MSAPPDTTAIQRQLAALEADNERLRTALAEAEIRGAQSGHGALLADALTFADPPLRCRHPIVPGRVSVIVPAYNAWAHLERAIRSVWSQTLPAERIEILVVDDGSSDGTRALAARIAAASPTPVRILTHEGGRNRGVAPTRQRAAEEATGEFIALLDADDAFLPRRLEWTLDVLGADDSLAAVCSLGRNVDADGRTVIGHNGTERAGEWRTLGDGLQPPFRFDQLWRVDPIANSSLTIRRAALERVGGFPGLMAHQAEDWLLVLKLSLLAPIPCIDDELIEYAHHPGAYTNTYHANGLREGTRLEVFYHLAWWMLRSPEHSEAGARFFRREYPRLVAEHQRLLPLVREYYAAGGRPATGTATLAEHLHQLTVELDTLRHVARLKMHENKQLRRLIASRAPASTDDSAAWSTGREPQ